MTEPAGGGSTPRWFHAVAPGLLMAATGVGAGDLATAAFTGAHLGTTVLWAVVLGAFLKFTLNEGLARWQLASGKSFLWGASRHLGVGVLWLFLPYLLLWSFFVGSALMSACGVTAHALLPIFDDPSRAKLVFGILHSLLGVALVLAGGFALFEKVMGVCIAIMFAVVVTTAGILWPGAEAVLTGLFKPTLGSHQGAGLAWTVALMGGVGGTVTVLCYGYWIREVGREGPEDLSACRLDLSLGYAMTALFGLSMVIIGSQVPVEGKGATLIVDIAARLEQELGPLGRTLFLLGAWGAVFSSLLGVWQCVPHLFADIWNHLDRKGREEDSSDGESMVDPRAAPYRAFLLALGTIPILGLMMSFKEVQKVYAVVGACFMPLLALSLLLLNGRAAWVGEKHRNRLPTVWVLLGTLGFFGWILVGKISTFF